MITYINPDKWCVIHHPVDLEQVYTIEYVNYKGDPKQYYKSEVLDSRRNFVYRNCDIKKSYDYGCGTNPFYINDESKPLHSYDKYVERYKEFNREAFFNTDTILFFDVLEHIFDLDVFLSMIPHKKIIATLPIWPNNELKSVNDLTNWKHYKPGEHIYYFTKNGFIEFVETKTPWKVTFFNNEIECPPRQDIGSVILELK